MTTPHRLTATPDPVPAGGDLDVTYTDSDRAGDTVTITFGDGTGQEEEREVTLDEEGVGSVTFTVPESWVVVQINAPDSAQLTVPVSHTAPTA